VASDSQGVNVKANLARFIWTAAILAAMALSLGAWMRW
jgi:hypothetical protein